MKPLAQYQEVAVTKFFGLLPEGAQRILEIGSDVEYAVVDNIAVRFSGTVTGINPAPGFVKRPPQEGPQNVTILEADGCNMPFDDKSFDAILSIATMEHVLNVPKFLEESHRVLKPGGVFYTNFSPIWSSGIGHHVCAFAGRKEARFWKPGRNPLPDFSHLLWDEEEMREYLLESPYDDRLIDPIIDWVYRSGNINRCFYEDYLEAFRESRLTVSAFVPGVYKSPSPELLDALRAKHGRHREFSHDSIESVLSRPSLASRLQRQHAAASLQPPAPEMKADKCSRGDTITMTRPTSRSAGTDNAAATTSRAALPQHSPQRCLSPEELFVMTNRRLGQFRNRHKGKRCVIIGNGPSLNKMDLSFLENEITFGMNRIFLMFDKWKFRPTYYVSVNPLVIEQSAAEILQINAPRFLSHKGIPFFSEPGDINFLRSVPQWFFSKDPRNGICEGWTVTYVAMQLAYFMGFDEVVLIGVDHHFVTQGDPNKEVVSEGDDPNHFHPGYFGKGTRWHLPDLERSEGSYQMAKQAFEAENRRILDATVDGKLTIFPKADYRELFHQTNRQCTDIPLAPADQRINESSGDKASCKISVITPSFNQGGYIEQTIRSVMAQNYPNHEHIIIDGGSDDDTVNILKRYTHIRWLSEKDRGQSDAINKGFRMATGDIIAWINSDDWYEPGTFSLIADFFHRHPDRNIVMGNCNLVDEHGVIFDTVVNHERGFDELKQHWVPRSIPTQPAIFFRRSLLDEFGLLDESLHYAMDYDLWMRFAQRNRFHHLDVTVANYRFHSAAKGGDHDWSKFLPDCKKVVDRYAVPRVSVVVPCYNYGRYLTEAVGSVLTQTFQDFEIIIVNDGSTDNSKEVAEQLIAAYPQYSIRLINQENSGNPAITRNRGIEEAHGTYILPLDADDMLMPTMIEECLKVLEQDQSVAIAYTDRQDFYGIDQVVHAGEYNFTLLKYQNHISYCAMFRRKVWEDVGGYRPVGCEDWDFWIATGARGHYGRRIPLPLFKYRRHDTGRFQQDSRNFEIIQARIMVNNQMCYSQEEVMSAESLIRKENGHTTSAEPLVSVIVPTHNRPDMLVDTIRSILNQTYRNFEIIVVNDAGADVEGVVNHLNREGNITYVRHAQNRGLAAARNTGIKVSRGKYIAYLDDDDIFYPDHLETLVSFMIKSGHKAAYSDAHRAHQTMNSGRYSVTERDIPYSYDFDYDTILVTNFVPVLCFIHEKGCIDEIGGFDESLTTHEDWDLWMRMSRHFKFAHIPRVTCEFTWRCDGSSMTSSKEEDFLRTARIIYEKNRNFVIDKPQLMEAQKNALAARESALRTNSDNSTTQTDQTLAKADSFAKEGKTDDAFTEYNKVLDTDPANARALSGVGGLNLLGGNYSVAADKFTSVLKLDPNSSKALCGLGMARNGQGHKNAGYGYFVKALKADPENITALNELFRAAYDNGKFAGAIACARNYLMYHPADLDILFSFACILYRTGAYKEARDVIERLMALSPEYQGGKELLESISLASESPDEVVASSRNSLVSSIEQGRINKAAGKYHEAFECFSAAWKLGDKSVLSEMGDCKANIDDMKGARGFYEEGLLNNADDVRSLVGMGVLSLLEENLANAGVYFGKALKAEKENPKALCGLAMVRNMEGRARDAHDLFTQALDSDPENLTTLFELVKCAYVLERFDEAERHLRNYLRYHPADMKILFSLAGVLLKMEKSNEALEALETILLFDPKFKGAWEMQQMIDKKLPIAV